MALSAGEMAEVERVVAGLSQDDIEKLRAGAEASLHEINRVMSHKVLSADETKAVHVAIEYLIRIECRQRGGGWWYRGRRRAQLIQAYFGRGGTISGFAIKGQANDNAVKLKTLTDLAARYLQMPTADLKDALQRDFQATAHNDCATFAYREAPEFYFTISGIEKQPADRDLMVMGRGELRGYTLYGNDGGQHWYSVAASDPFSEVTGAAKKLAKSMEAKFGIEDLSRMAARW